MFRSIQRTDGRPSLFASFPPISSLEWCVFLAQALLVGACLLALLASQAPESSVLVSLK